MQDLTSAMDAFTPVKANMAQLGRMTRAEKAFKELAGEILDLVPGGQPREKILNYLLICKFLSIQEITHNKGLRGEKEETSKPKDLPAGKKESKKEEVGDFGQ